MFRRWIMPTARFSGAEVETLRLPLPGGPLRLVYVTDIHRSRSFTEKHLALLRGQVEDLKPDLLLLGGDYGESRECALETLRALGKIPAPLGRVGCLGNNDVRLFPDREALLDGARAAGVELMGNGAMRLGDIALAAVDDIRHGEPEYKDYFAGLGGKLRLFLAHAPHSLPPAFAAMTVKPHLTLCGHTHGGQINVLGMTPYSIGFETALETHLPKPPVISGAGEYQGAKVIVSNGIGTSRIPLRINVPPQIWVVDIVK